MASEYYTFDLVASNIGNPLKESFYGFGTVWLEWAFNVQIKILKTLPTDTSQPIGTVRCWFNAGQKASATLHDVTEFGAGFWNAAIIMWGNGTWNAQVVPLKLPPAGTDSDSKDSCLNQLNNATSDYFIRFLWDDSVGTDSFISEGISGVSAQWNLYRSDLDSSGNLKELTLAKITTRWYNHNTSAPDWSKYGYAAVIDKVIPITTSEIGIIWEYYPWARKVSSSWKTLDKDIATTPSSSRTTYFRRKESGAWQDILNNPLKMSNQMGFYKANNSWQVAPRVGS